MSEQTTAPPPVGRGRGREGVARGRILDAASELFYAHGIRGTSADRIIEAAGLTKGTFYRHFPTKTELVVAYLERQAALERAGYEAAVDQADPLDALARLAEFIGTVSCMPGFRGCAFINAAAETPDPDDPVRVVVDSHRRWTHDLFAAIAARAGVADPETVARRLVMLRDGAMIGGYLGAPEEISETLRGAYLAAVRTDLPAAP
ncbi:TetR/AcrR family transcriptional regulator [Cellulomonas shaoxiangyii]|uniref:TetR/AcrR family transcriptional regulator n=1 Tax=Cellulomonas shaoxiangyii TaxID=2566013 RepID=UPI001FB66090|nr:TetR/AcrR family transcriptional regulator [Cellulomonas shaoxiangyii]